MCSEAKEEKDEKNGEKLTLELELLTLKNEVKLLESELEEERKKYNEIKNKMDYLTADFENFRKRVEKDKFNATLGEKERIIRKILPLVDELELATKMVNDSNDPLAKGLKMVLDKFIMFLREEGFEVIETVSKPFNPNMHESLDGKVERIVTEEVRKGFMFMGKVIRPSIVKVGNGGGKE
ncbi:MAG: nucleotide exchange factor GrpE [Thermoproteota archaeon]